MKTFGPVLLCFLLITACGGPESWPNDSFTPETWKQAPAQERYRFAHDIRESKVLLGKSPAQVVQMLGKPDFESKDGTYVSYLLRTGGGGFDQVFVLDVKFDAGHTVSEVNIRGD